MTREITRGIPWPGWRHEFKRQPKLKKFLAERGINVDSEIPPADFHLLNKFYRLRQLVVIGVVTPTTAADRFQRILERKGVGEVFYAKYKPLITTITEKITSSKF